MPADNGIRASVQQPKDRNYFLAPDPAASILPLDEPDFILPVDAPVVLPFFMFVCLVMLLVVLLVAPGPTFPSLDAPGAGWACANTLPVDSNRAHAQARIVFFMGNSLG